MPDPIWTTTMIAELEAAIAQGALSVKHGDKTVTYRSLAEMLQIRGEMRAYLDGAAARPRTSYATYGSGR